MEREEQGNVFGAKIALKGVWTMNIRGKMRLLLDSMSNNLFLTVLLLGMSFIAMYMIDTVISDHYYKDWQIRQWVAPYREDINRLYRIDYQASYDSDNTDNNEATYKLAKIVSECDGVIYSGQYSGTEVYDNNKKMISAIMTDRALLDMCSIKLSDSEIEKIKSYKGEMCPVVVGYELKDKYPIGYTFSWHGDVNDCVVAGYMPKGAMWIKHNMIGASDGGDDNLDNMVLMCPEDFEKLYRSVFGLMVRHKIYFASEQDNAEALVNKIYGEAAKLGCQINIVNIGEEVEAEKIENGFAGDKEFVFAIMIVIIAIISISASAVVMSMARRKSYGVMYAFGISIGEIGQIIAAENCIIVLLSGIAAWLIRHREIFNMYFKKGYDATGFYAKSWNYAHNIVTPLALLICGIIMIAAASVLPIILLGKEQPADMVKDNE